MSFQRFINPTRRSNTSLGPLSNNRFTQRPMVINHRQAQRGPIYQRVQPLQRQFVNGQIPVNNAKRLEDLQVEKDTLLQKLKDNEQLERDIKERAEQARKLKEHEEITRVRREVEKLQQQLQEKERYENWLRSKKEDERRQQEEQDIAYLQRNKNKLKQQIQQYEEVAIKIKDKEEMDRLRLEKDDIERRWSEIKVAEDQKRKIEEAELLAKQHQELKRKEIERTELERIERETQGLRERLRNKSHTEQWLEKRISQERAETNIANTIRRTKSNQKRGKPIVKSRSRKIPQRRSLNTVPTRAMNYVSDTDSIDDLSHLLPSNNIFGNSDYDKSKPVYIDDDLTDKGNDQDTVNGDYTNILDRIAKDLATTNQENTLGAQAKPQLNDMHIAMKSISNIQPRADDQPLTRLENTHVASSRVDINHLSNANKILPQNSVEEDPDSNLTELTKTMSELKNALAQSEVKYPDLTASIKSKNTCTSCNLKNNY